MILRLPAEAAIIALAWAPVGAQDHDFTLEGQNYSVHVERGEVSLLNEKGSILVRWRFKQRIEVYCYKEPDDDPISGGRSWPINVDGVQYWGKAIVSGDLLVGVAIYNANMHPIFIVLQRPEEDEGNDEKQI